MKKKRAAAEPVASAPAVSAPTVSIALVTSLALGTGWATMAHEVAWTRIARTLLGGDARAVTAAVMAVLAGLALGALVAPVLSRRFGALGAFARAEGAAAVYALALPYAADLASHAVGAALRTFGPGAALGASSLLVATVLLLPAAVALGAGVPLLAQARAQTGSSARDAGLLYGAHALGSAAGSVASAFVLLPSLGVPGVALLACGVQLVCAASALVSSRRTSAPGAPPTVPETPRAPRWTRTHALLLTAALVQGASTLALQTLWTRVAALAVGPSVQGFSLVSAVYVLALALGAGTAAFVVPRAKRPGYVFALLLGAASVAVLGGLPWVGAWPTRAADVFAESASGGAPWTALAFLLAAPIVPVIALTSAAFPFGVEALYRDGRGAPVRDVGQLVGAAALGNVIGAPLATFVLVPVLGPSRAVVVAALMLLGASCLAVAPSLRGRASVPAVRLPHALGFLTVCLAASVLLARAPRRFDPAVLSAGPFLYAGPGRPELGRVVFAHEGVDALVTVRDDGHERLLQIDGKVDASAHGDAATQRLVGLFPALIARRPSRALVVGLGTGQTVDAVLRVPGVEHVDVAELVEGVRYAQGYFARDSGHVLDDARVRVVPADGALLLRHSAEQWDVIISEPSNPWVAGMGELFAEETFRAARARLTEGGVMATWFHVYATDLSIVRDIAGTFQRVFPGALLFEVVRGEDYLLVGRRDSGRRDPARLDADQLAARLADPGVRAELARGHVADAPGLLARLVSGELGPLAGARVLSSRDGSLEARASQYLYSDASVPVLETFAALPPPRARLFTTPRTEAGRALLDALPNATRAGALGRTLLLRLAEHDEEGAIRAGEQAVGLLPGDPTLLDALAVLYLARAKTHALSQREDVTAREELLTVLELDAPDVDLRVDALATLATLELRDGNARAGLDRFQAARQLRPDSPDLARGVAQCLDALGAHEDAARERAWAERVERAARER